MPQPFASRPPVHLVRAVLVALAVLLLHALMLAVLLNHSPRPGSSWPTPIRAEFVRVLELAPPSTLTLRPAAPAPAAAVTPGLGLTVPAALAASTPKAPRLARADLALPLPLPAHELHRMRQPASAPRSGEAAASAPMAQPAVPPPSGDATGSAASGTGASALSASAPVGSASTAAAQTPGPEWPLSTQLRYVLSGDFRGPLHGTGEVQWLRDGAHYQVRVAVTVDPGLGRTMVSEGRITPTGLAPARYVEETRLLFEAAHTSRLAIAADTVALPGGRSAPAPDGLQDSASQFVQLTWLLRTGRLAGRPGEVVTLPLALPDRVAPWSYVVGAPEPVELPFATVQAIPLTPTPASVRPKDWPAQVWFAPHLQHLPVRIRIQAGPEITVDLRLAELPRQAAPPTAPAAAP